MSAAPDLPPEFLDPLLELLAIPSVSTGEGNAYAIAEAAEWLRSYIEATTGASSWVEQTEGNPLVLADLRAANPDAPRVLIYGHYDVQGEEPLDEWESPPFQPTIRDGRIYARGASDNKGNFWPLLYEACAMSAAGELPVNVRVLVEGEEERGSPNVLGWLERDTEEFDAAIIYDSGQVGRTPTISIGGRGVTAGYVTVRTAKMDMHSGVYGGVAANALHVLMDVLKAPMAGPDGLLCDELRAGIDPIPAVEREAWATMADTSIALDRIGANPMFEGAAAAMFERTGFETTFEVNEIVGGDPRTVIPASATAYVSMRLGPGQDHEQIRAAAEKIMRDAAPEWAEVTFSAKAGVNAAGFDPESAVLRAARRAFQKTFDVEPALWRQGGTVPLLDVLKRQGVDTVFTGFAGAGDLIHAPNESYRLSSLDDGRRAARALYEELATL